MDRQRHVLRLGGHLRQGCGRQPCQGILVDTSLPGYSASKIENKISLRTVQNADIILDDVVVPDFFKLANANSFRDTNKVLKVTRLAVARQAVGLQLAAFDVARSYAVQRQQFGKPTAAFQLVQSQLVQIWAMQWHQWA